MKDCFEQEFIVGQAYIYKSGSTYLVALYGNPCAYTLRSKVITVAYKFTFKDGSSWMLRSCAGYGATVNNANLIPIDENLLPANVLQRLKLIRKNRFGYSELSDLSP